MPINVTDETKASTTLADQLNKKMANWAVNIVNSAIEFTFYIEIRGDWCAYVIEKNTGKTITIYTDTDNFLNQYQRWLNGNNDLKLYTILAQALDNNPLSVVNGEICDILKVSRKLSDDEIAQALTGLIDSYKDDARFIRT